MASLLKPVTVPRSSGFLSIPSAPTMASPVRSLTGSRKISSFSGFSTFATMGLRNSTFVSMQPLTVFKRDLNQHQHQLFTRRIKTNPQQQHQPRSASVVVAAQLNPLVKVLRTAWRVGKDGIEAGTNLVPDSVPRPVARVSVAVVATFVSLFVLKSFISTVSFVLAMMGLIYFVFIALNKDEGPRGGGGNTPTEEDSLEEARRIMEKYK